MVTIIMGVCAGILVVYAIQKPETGEDEEIIETFVARTKYLLIPVTAAIWFAVRHYYMGSAIVAIEMSVFFTFIIACAWTDAAYYTVPDRFTVTGLICAACISITNVLMAKTSPFTDVLGVLFGACTGAGATYIVGWLGSILFKKEAMGGGDMTFMAMAGAHLGPSKALLTIMVAAALGTCIAAPIVWALKIRRFRQPPALYYIPFVVFLGPAAVITLVQGDKLIRLYQAFIGRF